MPENTPSDAHQTPDILVVSAHPHRQQSRVNRALGGAAASLARVEVRDLYALYPDYFIDAAAEQAALARARLVVWQHPIHWYHMPPLMKLWVDEVLGFGWAYGPGGTALRGKDLWLVASTGGSEDSYHPSGHNRYPFDAFLPPYEQTATLCGMRFLPPLIVHGAHGLEADSLAAQAAVFADRLGRYPDWPEIGETADCMPCEVPPAARPDPADARATPAPRAA